MDAIERENVALLDQLNGHRKEQDGAARPFDMTDIDEIARASAIGASTSMVAS
jgi:hypothetical protein